MKETVEGREDEDEHDLMEKIRYCNLKAEAVYLIVW
jgi:hypothetical protein